MRKKRRVVVKVMQWVWWGRKWLNVFMRGSEFKPELPGWHAWIGRDRQWLEEGKKIRET